MALRFIITPAECEKNVSIINENVSYTYVTFSIVMHLIVEFYDCHKYIIYGYQNLTAKYLKGSLMKIKYGMS